MNERTWVTRRIPNPARLTSEERIRRDERRATVERIRRAITDFQQPLGWTPAAPPWLDLILKEEEGR